jgi:hypothetical protein
MTTTTNEGETGGAPRNVVLVEVEFLRRHGGLSPEPVTAPSSSS